MDVPARQAYVMGPWSTPPRQTGAASYTNTARYLTRPAGPGPWPGPPQSGRAGPARFLLAAVIKSGYDPDPLWRVVVSATSPVPGEPGSPTAPA